MPVAIPDWAIGKHVTMIKLTPQIVSTTTGSTVVGTSTISTVGLSLTDHTSFYSLYGHVDEVTIEEDSNVENLSAHNRQIENNVLIESKFTLNLAEFEKSVGLNVLAAAYHLQISSTSILYWKAEITRASNTFTMYGLLSSYNFQMRKNRVMGNGKFLTIDPGGSVANPAYA